MEEQPYEFNGGDDVRVPIVFVGTDDLPIDISSGDVRVELFHDYRRLFTAEFVRLNDIPGEDEAHGLALFTEEQSGAIPPEWPVYLKGTFYRPADDLTVSARPIYMKRVL